MLKTRAIPLRAIIAIAGILAISACDAGDSGEIGSSASPPRADTFAPGTRPGPAIPALTTGQFRLVPVEELGLTGSESVDDVAAALSSSLGATEPVEGFYSERTSMVEVDGRVSIAFTLDQLPDDSLLTEQHVVELQRRPDGSTRITGYGVRFRCRRAADPDAWTTDSCP